MSRALIIVGLVLIVLGVAWNYTPWLLNWFGRLPGDIRYQSGNTRIFIPITSMLIVSIVLTILVNIFRK
ncbi:MAG: DUF2905 domain-containing protein [Gammaproteobacteria bacterium]